MATDDSECATLHVLTTTGEDIEVSLGRNGSRSIVHLTTAKGRQASVKLSSVTKQITKDRVSITRKVKHSNYSLL